MQSLEHFIIQFYYYCQTRETCLTLETGVSQMHSANLRWSFNIRQKFCVFFVCYSLISLNNDFKSSLFLRLLISSLLPSLAEYLFHQKKYRGYSIGKSPTFCPPTNWSLKYPFLCLFQHRMRIRCVSSHSRLTLASMLWPILFCFLWNPNPIIFYFILSWLLHKHWTI